MIENLQDKFYQLENKQAKVLNSKLHQMGAGARTNLKDFLRVLER